LHNVVGGPSVDVYLGDQKILWNLSYGELTSYIDIEGGKQELVIKSNNEIITEKYIQVNGGDYYTIIIGGNSNNVEFFSYKDKNGCSKQGYSYLRFIHNVYGAPGVDVYINNVETFVNIKYGQQSKYQGIKLGRNNDKDYLPIKNVEIYVTGTKNKVAGPIPVYMSSGGIYTLFAIGNIDNNLIEAKFSHDNEDKCKFSCEILQENFNVQKYMGKWYLIGSIPQFYDKGCERQTAEYTHLSESIKVYNKCYDRGGKMIRSVIGSAVPESPCQPAALKVSFPEQPFDFPFANYLVHKTNYTDYAIVGSPTRDAFYILSRKSKMSESQYNKFLQYAKKLGYNYKLIVPSYHAVIPSN